MPLLKFLLVVALSGILSSGEKQAVVATKADSSVKTNQTLFSYIRTHRQAKNVVINWGVSSVAGVHHFEVYHSEVGDFFDPIGNVDPNGSNKYTFKQESVFPGYHYYYIKAVMNNGAPSVESPVDVVRIVGH